MPCCLRQQHVLPSASQEVQLASKDRAEPLRLETWTGVGFQRSAHFKLWSSKTFKFAFKNSTAMSGDNVLVVLNIPQTSLWTVVIRNYHRHAPIGNRWEWGLQTILKDGSPWHWGCQRISANLRLYTGMSIAVLWFPFISLLRVFVLSVSVMRGRRWASRGVPCCWMFKRPCLWIHQLKGLNSLRGDVGLKAVPGNELTASLSLIGCCSWQLW